MKSHLALPERKTYSAGWFDHMNPCPLDYVVNLACKCHRQCQNFAKNVCKAHTM